MNLLDDPVFTVETSTGHEMCSLPRIYALLCDDAVELFAKLQAHQKQAWHCFLAQLGAIATENRDLPETESGWREALAALTVPEAWNLYTEDLSKPAFMQPPVPEETLDGWDSIDVTSYDIPSLAKNHGIKKHRNIEPQAEHWVYMLTNVQTSDTYGGSGHPKSSRGMQGRCFLTTTSSLRHGRWILYDIARLHNYSSAIKDEYGYSEKGYTLLWTVPWGESLAPDQLHPWYIDCCRRVRKDDQWLVTSTNDLRVEEPPNGETGDAWAAVDRTKSVVLRPRDSTFRYDQLWAVLFSPDYLRPPGFSEIDKGYIVFRAMPKDFTERTSIRERILPFSNLKRGWNKIERESKRRVQKAETAESIFSHALDWLLCEDANEGPNKDSKEHKKKVRKVKSRQKNALHARIDQRFFDRLFEAPDMSDEERQTFWETILVDALQTQMKEAMTLCPNKQPWKRKAHAQSVFTGRMRHEFTYAKQHDTSYGTESNANDRNADKPHHAAV